MLLTSQTKLVWKKLKCQMHLLNFRKTFVAYFDQGWGAAQPKCWSKGTFFKFNQNLKRRKLGKIKPKMCFFLGIKPLAVFGSKLKKTVFMLKILPQFFSFFLLFQLFASKMLQNHIWTRVCSAQHSNTG